MSDRCYVQVTTVARFFQQLKEAIGVDDEGVVGEDEMDEISVGNKKLWFSCCEANYGGVEELTEKAREGAVFTGYHGPGGEYGAHVFCGVDGEFYECSCNYDASPVVQVENDGTVREQDLAEVVEFLNKRKSAERTLDLLKGFPALAGNEE